MGSGAGDRQVPVGGSGQGPAIVSRRSRTDLLDLFPSEVDFLETLVNFNDEPLQLYPFQSSLLHDQSKFRSVNKARQMGFSLTISLEALARCYRRKNYSAHIVSFSQAEAKEKIHMARQAHESLPPSIRRKLVADNALELAFASPGGGISRINAHPSKPLRGFKGDVYLDELAHYVDDREVYSGSTAAITHGGQLTGISTPLGRRGIFWEIAEQELQKFPYHSRHVVPWWLAPFFCSDVPGAIRAHKEGASTRELVGRFGTQTLRVQFHSLAIEDFEQEFCCSFSAADVAFIPIELVLSAASLLSVPEDPAEVPRCEGRLVAGFDVARHRDLSVLTVFEERDGTYTCRLMATYANMSFKDQEDRLRRVLELLPISRLSIDKNGMGEYLAENLERAFPGIAIGERFSNETKQHWATRLKILLQQRNLLLPRDRRVVSHFQAVKKIILPTGNIRFDADRSAEGHADIFWSVALAVQSVEPAYRGGNVRMRIIGDGGVIYDSNEENPQPPRSNPDPGSYEWNKRLFPDGVYTDDNPPPPLPTFRPVTAAEAAAGPVQYGRSKRSD